MYYGIPITKEGNPYQNYMQLAGFQNASDLQGFPVMIVGKNVCSALSTLHSVSKFARGGSENES